MSPMRISEPSLSYIASRSMYKAFIESWRGFLAELEATQVGGRRLSGITIDVKSGQVDLAFEDTAPRAKEARLAAYEQQAEGEKRDWQKEFEIWQRKHFGSIRREDYQRRAEIELDLLLRSGFLLPDKDLLNREKLAKATAALERMKLPTERAAEYALLCDLLRVEDGLFSFADTERLERYLEEYGDSLSPRSITALVRFKYVTGLITPLLEELTARSRRTRVKPEEQAEARTREVFRLNPRLTSEAHFKLLYALLAGRGWLRAASEEEWLRLFGGTACSCVVTWTGRDSEGKQVGTGTLKELFAQMIRQQIVTCTNNEYLAVIESHFQDAGGQYLKNLKSAKASQKNQPVVDDMVRLLRMPVAELMARLRQEEYLPPAEKLTEGIDEEFRDIRYGRREYWDEHKGNFE